MTNTPLEGEDGLPKYSPPLIAVCTYEKGDHVHWEIDSPAEAASCIMECDCTPLVYARHPAPPKLDQEDVVLLRQAIWRANLPGGTDALDRLLTLLQPEQATPTEEER